MFLLSKFALLLSLSWSFTGGAPPTHTHPPPPPLSSFFLFLSFPPLNRTSLSHNWEGAKTKGEKKLWGEEGSSSKIRSLLFKILNSEPSALPKQLLAYSLSLLSVFVIVYHQWCLCDVCDQTLFSTATKSHLCVNTLFKELYWLTDMDIPRWSTTNTCCRGPFVLLTQWNLFSSAEIRMLLFLQGIFLLCIAKESWYVFPLKDPLLKKYSINSTAWLMSSVLVWQ